MVDLYIYFDNNLAPIEGLREVRVDWKDLEPRLSGKTWSEIKAMFSEVSMFNQTSRWVISGAPVSAVEKFKAAKAFARDKIIEAEEESKMTVLPESLEVDALQVQ